MLALSSHTVRRAHTCRLGSGSVTLIVNAVPAESECLANRRTTPVICTTFESPDILVARTLRNRSLAYAFNEEHCFIHLSTLVATCFRFGSRHCRLECAGI